MPAPGVALTYRQAIARLAGHHGVKPGLERTRALLDSLGDPGAGLRGVLVAGTNGKGSVCAIVDSICRESGLRTVMLTNPHLRSYCERIVIDGAPIEEEHFARLVEEVLDAASAAGSSSRPPTQFETLTAVGALACAGARAEVVVCEVGLGGRLDSTNVLDLGVAAITNVDLDHQEYLGDTIAEIAAEKAGIIKPGNHVVTGATGVALRVVRERCARLGATLTVVGEEVLARGNPHDRDGTGIDVHIRIDGGVERRITLPLRGEHQVANAAVALAVCDRLRRVGVPIDDASAERGAARVRWPGRVEWRAGAPAILLDGAHNPAGMEALVTAATALCAGRPVVALFGAMADKDTESMLAILRRLTSLAVMTAPANDRSAAPGQLARLWGEGATVAASTASGLARARSLAGQAGVVVACGSLYLVGELLEELDGPLTASRT